MSADASCGIQSGSSLSTLIHSVSVETGARTSTSASPAPMGIAYLTLFTRPCITALIITEICAQRHGRGLLSSLCGPIMTLFRKAAWNGRQRWCPDRRWMHYRLAEKVFFNFRTSVSSCLTRLITLMSITCIWSLTCVSLSLPLPSGTLCSYIYAFWLAAIFLVNVCRYCCPEKLGSVPWGQALDVSISNPTIFQRFKYLVYQCCQV